MFFGQRERWIVKTMTISGEKRRKITNLRQLVHIALANILDNLRVGVPEPVAGDAECVASSHTDEQLVLLGHVVQDLRFRLTKK